MIQRNLAKWYQMASKNMSEKLDKLSSLTTGKPQSSKRQVEEDSDNHNVKFKFKKRKEKKVPVYDGDYYFDFKHGLRYVYPYDFRFKAFAKRRWFGRPVGEVYGEEFRVHSPNTLDYMFGSGKITVNNEVVTPDYKIKNGDRIASYVHRHENPCLASKFNIIRETDDMLVINKPSSIPIHPTGKYRLNTILGILSKEYDYKQLHTVHRLDRLTSGVLILAKNPKKACELSQMIISRNVEKEYVCKVDGEFPADEVICTAKLDVLDQKIGFRFVCDTGKECLTKFKRLHTDGKTSIVHCKLETGRTHQIRVHLQFLGYPICNDPFYNSYAFGPNKGKDAEYHQLKTVEQLINDIGAEHPTNKLNGDDVEYELKCQDLEQSLAQGEFYDDANFKLAEESRFVLIKNELFDRHINELEVTDEQVDSYIDQLANCDILNTKVDLPYLKANKHMKFSKEKYDVNVCCELCHMYHKPPRIDELSLYLHAMRYKIDDQVYFAEPPSWAQYSDEVDFSKLTF